MAKNPMEMTGGMRIPTTSQRRSNANRGFVVFATLSVLLHGGAIGGVVAYQNLKPKARRPVEAVTVELVRLGKPRDPKLLPRKTAPALAPKDDGVALDTGNKTKPEKRRKPQKKSPEMSDAARRMLEGSDARLDDALSKLDSEEPEGQEDGDIMGTAARAKNAATKYQAEIARTLKSKYVLPTTIPASQRRFLSAEVVLFIERNGTISRYEIVKAHPNQAFMASVETMLKRTKLPPPPRELADQYLDTGVGVRFKP
ncbi:MAG: TonB C-terminal domain-containing protein [Deltaproteobacteria bacterium]